MKVLMTLFLFALGVNAASLDDLGYTTTGGKIIITNCDEAATGELVIPQTIEGNPVTSIGEQAFGNCYSLTNITLPDGLTSIGWAAFAECTSLTSITIPDSVTSIGFGCFTGSPITNLEIPSRFSLALTYLGISPELSYQKLMEFNASNGEATADETLEAFSQNLDVLNENDQFIGEQLTTLGQNDILIGEQMTILGENDQSISEQMATLSQNDETIMTEINAMKAQLQTLVAAVAQKDAEIAEKDAEIAELKQGGEGQTLEQVLEQVQDARLGSVILNPDAEGNMTLKLEIEESSDLSVWENNGESVEVELPLTEGKKFLRFALK
nr:leucine-rich repeat protein [bacterium]